MTIITPDAADRAPDLIVPVIGFRQWQLDGDTLRSPFRHNVWDAATFTARCSTDAHPDHPAPVGPCSCGTHAWYAQCPRLASAATSLVAGAIVLWGRV